MSVGHRHIKDYEPLPLEDQQYPLEFAEENRVIKLKESDGCVTVGVCPGVSQGLVHRLEVFHRKTIDAVTVDPVEFASYLGKLHGYQSGLGNDGAQNDGERLFLDRVANDAPVVNYINSLMIDAIKDHASDIHFECFDESAVVRYRVDGVLATVDRFPKERFAAVSTRLKIMANLNIMEKRLPQDGRITVTVGQESVDIRASFVPIARGESIVLRLFGKSKEPLSLSQLGMDHDTLVAVERLVKHPHGLILVTGPTGSGKTTTLTAMLRKVKSDELKLITIEDPIENVVEGVNQIQTNDGIGLTFDSILRRVLRQDPNVIMVGEIRDHATAELVVRASLTGHLVLSTLHTNDAISAIARLRDIGVEPYLIAGVLRGAIAQRLVRKVCPLCSKKEKPNVAELVLAKRLGVELKSIARAVGCPSCHGSGYLGRVAIFEHFLVNEAFSELIAKGERTTALRIALENDGIRSLSTSGMLLVAQGTTTIEELEREVDF